MSVLVDVDIRKLAATGDFISEFDPLSVESASYDMRLGPQYFKQGAIHTLSNESPTVILLPGEFAVLRSLEELTMPLSLVGHNGIMSPWAKRGLVSLFSPQIDPGFEGFLTVPVFNAGDAPISINFKQKIFTIEFEVTSQPASYGWAQKHGRQNRMDIPTSPSHVRPSSDQYDVLQQELRSTSHKVDVLEARLIEGSARKNYNVGRYTLLFTILASFLAFAALVVSVFSSDYLRSRIGLTPGPDTQATSPKPAPSTK